MYAKEFKEGHDIVLTSAAWLYLIIQLHSVDVLSWLGTWSFIEGLFF